MRSLVGMIAGAAVVLYGAAARAETWRVEAERAGEGSIQPALPGLRNPSWKVESSTNAIAGAFLGGTASWETHPIATRIPRAGPYRVWVRHYQTPGKPSGIMILIRDNTGEVAGFHRLDWQSRVMSERPYQKPPEPPKDAKPAFVWSVFDTTFERAMEVALSFGPAGGSGGAVGIDCAILSDDPAFDPEKKPSGNLAAWAALPVEPGAIATPAPPDGMRTTPVFRVHSAFFAGEADPERQFKLGFVNNTPVCLDYAWLVQLGVNHDHGWSNGNTNYGVHVLAEPMFGYFNPDFVRQHLSPTGRFVNAEGKVSGQFSVSYEPYRRAVLEQLATQVGLFKDDESVATFRIADESGGQLDYSDYSRDAFHRWLAQRYGAIGRLNERWGTSHESFDRIPLPQATNANKACWFAFREFCGLQFVNLYADKAKVVARTDSKKRPVGSQASGLHLLSPTFTVEASIDFEDLIGVGFAGQPEFGWDAYSTEDYFVGADADLLLSLLKGQALVNNEFNVHGPDPRIMARTYWTMVGKGLKGVITYMLHNNPAAGWGATMWPLLNVDLTPRAKLGAIADANHEIRRLERMLAPAKPVPMVKPVALYYSRMDLSLPQPVFDVYGSAIDSPYRVYSILRGMGYPVRWITPRQIVAGALKEVGAVVMVDVKYVPGDAAKQLAEWVRAGGCIIGDEWPGIFDERGKEQGVFAEVFGIRAATPKKVVKDAKLALQETTTTMYGVDPDVLRALNPDELSKKVDEMWEQWDSTHPVAKAVGPWHLSGYDLKSIEVVSGQVIGMSYGGPGRPAMTINDYGKGHALYCAMMLGTLYEAGPVYFEWDSMREGTGLGRLLDAYLRFSGVEPFARIGLPERMAQKMRVEVPLVDAKRNALVGMVSLNDGPLPAFPLSLRWPLESRGGLGAAPAPKIVLACLGGSRRIEAVPFEAKGGQLTLTMPGFDTHAMLLALTDSDPLVSLDVAGAARGEAGLLDVRPGARLTVKATVWNPSSRKLPEGTLRLYAAPGWFCDRGEAAVHGIEPYGSAGAQFTAAAPAVCARRTLRPLVLKYESGKRTSSPATELVWWQPVNGDRKPMEGSSPSP